MPLNNIYIYERRNYRICFKKIRQLRGDKGLSQEFLAEELGVCQTTYGRIENGRQKISGEQLLKVAKILGISINQLVGEQENYKL